jgi:Na+-driven multidrug efflux pump
MDVCSGVLRGMGKAIVSTAISLVGACLLRVVWLWTVFPIRPTLEIIFISYPITWMITTVSAFIMIQILISKLLKKQA